MIKYTIMCSNQHEFEVWFSSGNDYEKQARKSQIVCPECGCSKTKKAPMAPFVKKAGNNTSSIRKTLENNFENVGEEFANEARAMHYGEKKKRNIYGNTSVEQAKSLIDEGVEVFPIPDICVPRDKKKLS